jgi:hypothetical protein
MKDKCKNCNGKGYIRNYFVRKSERRRIPEYLKCPFCSRINEEKNK